MSQCGARLKLFPAKRLRPNLNFSPHKGVGLLSFIQSQYVIMQLCIGSLLHRLPVQ